MKTIIFELDIRVGVIISDVKITPVACPGFQNFKDDQARVFGTPAAGNGWGCCQEADRDHLTAQLASGLMITFLNKYPEVSQIYSKPLQRQRTCASGLQRELNI